MLSKNAFNALLKTLEEPPPHIQFLLATTDPQKLPITVLSRCLQFPLKRLPVKDISAQLEKILGAEGVQSDAEALTEIARAADGSMRDALSLMDQAIAFGDGVITGPNVLDMLGSVARTALHAVLAAIAARDGAALLQALQTLDEQAPDYAQVLEGLAGGLHHIALLQMVPDAPLEEAEYWRDLSQQMQAADVQLYYDITLAGRRDLDWAPDPKSGLEMTCLRMLAFAPADNGVAPVGGAKKSPPKPESVPVKPADAPATPAAEPVQPAQPVAPEAHVSTAASTVDEPANDWDTLVARLGLRGMAAQLARNCVCANLDTTRVELELPHSLQNLLTDNAKRQLQEALQVQLSPDVALTIKLGAAQGVSPAKLAEVRVADKQAAAQQAIKNDPMVQTLQNQLGAHIRDNSIKPIDGNDTP